MESTTLPRPPRQPSSESMKRKRIKVHASTQRDMRLRMVSVSESEAEMKKKKAMESSVRRFTPTVQQVNRYFWAKTAMSKTQEELMSAQVNLYLSKLKSSRPKYETQIVPRELRSNEIPVGLVSAFTEQCARPGPRKIVKAFDEMEYYQSRQAPLTANLPDTYTTRAFRAYIERNNERVPETLTRSFRVCQPEEPPSSPRRRKRY